jgi:hypothetical protein
MGGDLFSRGRFGSFTDARPSPQGQVLAAMRESPYSQLQAAFEPPFLFRFSKVGEFEGNGLSTTLIHIVYFWICPRNVHKQTKKGQGNAG